MGPASASSVCDSTELLDSLSECLLSASVCKGVLFAGLTGQAAACSTIALGTVFVSVQGYEWVQLISFGLTITSSTYGGVFYLIIGAHGLHVIGGLLALLACLRRLNSTSQQLTIDNLRAAQIFWYFVVGVWPVLYTLVYLL